MQKKTPTNGRLSNPPPRASSNIRGANVNNSAHKVEKESLMRSKSVQQPRGANNRANDRPNSEQSSVSKPNNEKGSVASSNNNKQKPANVGFGSKVGRNLADPNKPEKTPKEPVNPRLNPNAPFAPKKKIAAAGNNVISSGAVGGNSKITPRNSNISGRKPSVGIADSSPSPNKNNAKAIGGFAKLQALSNQKKGPVVVTYEDEPNASASPNRNKGRNTRFSKHNDTNKQSMELVGQSEYIKIDTSADNDLSIAGDQLDKLLSQARKARN